MATIKPIEGRSVHQIQSGQVISDGLTSVVKELVENSIDAHATSIEVRFKNYGLDAIEVVDNGTGITPDNYASIALKHWTSKLTTYTDLTTITTFGFRGEALSSLCALSDLQITTATASDAPKGTRLDFETSGELKSRSVAAAQRGTTVLVENIFKTLPVRRKELERNIKREYTKVLGVLQAYAGVCVGVRFAVFNQPVKGRRTPVFATKGNKTTRENIANVFGARTMGALVALELVLEMKSTRKGVKELESKEVKVVGHISRPIVGEGRQAPDRQMFFVNGRPCVLPQIARAFNEVYKTFNVTQSPFIFADLQMDTNAYDVNVSPDKRTILLHDQTELLESLKASLITMFTNHEQTVPHSQLGTSKLPSYKQLTLHRPATQPDSDAEPTDTPQHDPVPPTPPKNKAPTYTIPTPTTTKFKPPTSFAARTTADELTDSILAEEAAELLPPPVAKQPTVPDPPLYRSPRRQREKVTITIGDREPVTMGGSPTGSLSPPRKRRRVVGRRGGGGFGRGGLRRFAAGSQVEEEEEEEEEEEWEGEDEDEDEDEDEVVEVVDVEEEEDEVVDVDKEEDGDEVVVLDEMVLDDEGDEDLEEMFREASGVEKMTVDAEEEWSKKVEPIVLDQEDVNPLFLPNPELDAMLSGDEVVEEVAEEVTLEAPANEATAEEIVAEEEEEDDFADPENLTQSSLLAQQLLLEAEAVSTTPKGLERAFQILEGSRTHSTKNLVRTYSTSISKLRQQSKATPKSPVSSNPLTSLSALTLTEDDASAEERLNLTITKQDFLTMQIKGQFNRGFILATRADDLFIIDQHASDEKYNFETLQRDTVVQHQRLVVPKNLELMAMDEVVVSEHLPVFRKNGFVIEIDPEAPTGARCRLVTLPLSGSTVFGVGDLEELIHLVHESGESESVRCSKVRSMFAMRACKKSTKVGRALTVKGMERIVRHMGELDKPWNCPHGRPTMRHLLELGRVQAWGEFEEEWGGMGGLQWRGQSWRDVKAAMDG